MFGMGKRQWDFLALTREYYSCYTELYFQTSIIIYFKKVGLEIINLSQLPY